MGVWWGSVGFVVGGRRGGALVDFLIDVVGPFFFRACVFFLFVALYGVLVVLVAPRSGSSVSCGVVSPCGSECSFCALR